MSEIRTEVFRLAQWAPLPRDEEWTEYDLERYAADVQAVTAPLSTAERLALMPLLDAATYEDAFGVTIGVLNLIESAPHPPYWWRDLDEALPLFATLKAHGRNLERDEPQHVADLQSGECPCSIAYRRSLG